MCSCVYIKKQQQQQMKEREKYDTAIISKEENSAVFLNNILKYFSLIIKIYIYFPQRGHWFNYCDGDFATVKSKIRRDHLFTH